MALRAHQDPLDLRALEAHLDTMVLNAAEAAQVQQALPVHQVDLELGI